MSEIPQISKKERFAKGLAIIGFICTIILIAWLSIKLVAIMPSAFTSLASLAEVVHRGEQPTTEPEQINESTFIQVSSSKTLLSSGEPITASWVSIQSTGTYVFSYACVPGIAIEVVDNENLRGIDCGASYNLGDTTSLTFTIDSEKERYADVTYTIAFLGTNDQTPRASGSASLTIINNEIENLLGQPNEETATPDTEAEVGEVVTTPVDTPPQTPTTPVTPPVTTTPPVEPVYVYEIPISNPTGRTDLGVRYVAAGTITNNTFSASAIKQNSTGAIQFAVKNYGTKTSDSWQFTVSLPNGSTFESGPQLPLKPNEQSLLTVGFPTSDISAYTFIIRTTEPTDQNTLNNATSQRVTFVK